MPRFAQCLLVTAVALMTLALPEGVFGQAEKKPPTSSGATVGKEQISPSNDANCGTPPVSCRSLPDLVVVSTDDRVRVNASQLGFALFPPS